MQNDTPYLSVVIVSRNDDHGVDMRQRTTVCLMGMIEQLERHRIPSELIFVEWLPPADRPLLRDILPWPSVTKYCSIKVVVVPPEKVGDYEYTEEYSIRDLTPWNTGIKRARGEFILSTVTDILLSDDFFQMVAKRQLDKDRFYRIDRCDVNRNMLNIKGLDEQLKYCRRNIIDMHTLNPVKFILKPGVPVLHDKAPGDFILMAKDQWHRIHGFPQNFNCGADTLAIYSAYASGVKQKILKKPIRLFHIDHDSIWKTSSYLYFRKLLIRLKIPYKLVDVLSVLLNRLYSTRSSLEKLDVKLISSQEVKEIVTEMISGKRSFILNGSDWGLGRQNLIEYKVQK